MPRLRLYYSEQLAPEVPAFGCDLNRVLELLGKLEEIGVGCDRVSTDGWPEERLHEAYSAATIPVIRKKHRVRQIFGTRTSSGDFFGRQVPALVVYKGSTDRAVDVFPHEEGPVRVEIVDYLKHLLAREEAYLAKT